MTVLAPSGKIVTPVGFDPNGVILPLQVNANGFVIINYETTGAGTGIMLSPQGNLVTPAGFDPDGNIVPIQMTAEGYLRASLEGFDAAVQALIDATIATLSSDDVFWSNGNGGVVAAGATNYLGFFILGLSATGGNLPVPLAGKIRRISQVINSTQPASGSLVLNLYVGNNPSTLGLTIPAGSLANTYQNLTDELSVAEGALVKMSYKNNAAANSAAIGALTVLYEIPVVS